MSELRRQMRMRSLYRSPDDLMQEAFDHLEIAADLMSAAGLHSVKAAKMGRVVIRKRMDLTAGHARPQMH